MEPSTRQSLSTVQQPDHYENNASNTCTPSIHSDIGSASQKTENVTQNIFSIPQTQTRPSLNKDRKIDSTPIKLSEVASTIGDENDILLLNSNESAIKDFRQLIKNEQQKIEKLNNPDTLKGKIKFYATKITTSRVGLSVLAGTGLFLVFTIVTASCLFLPLWAVAIPIVLFGAVVISGSIFLALNGDSFILSNQEKHSAEESVRLINTSYDYLFGDKSKVKVQYDGKEVTFEQFLVELYSPTNLQEEDLVVEEDDGLDESEDASLIVTENHLEHETKRVIYRLDNLGLYLSLFEKLDKLEKSEQTLRGFNHDLSNLQDQNAQDDQIKASLDELLQKVDSKASNPEELVLDDMFGKNKLYLGKKDSFLKEEEIDSLIASLNLPDDQNFKKQALKQLLLQWEAKKHEKRVKTIREQCLNQSKILYNPPKNDRSKVLENFPRNKQPTPVTVDVDTHKGIFIFGTFGQEPTHGHFEDDTYDVIPALITTMMSATNPSSEGKYLALGSDRIKKMGYQPKYDFLSNSFVQNLRIDGKTYFSVNHYLNVKKLDRIIENENYNSGEKQELQELKEQILQAKTKEEMDSALALAHELSPFNPTSSRYFKGFSSLDGELKKALIHKFMHTNGELTSEGKKLIHIPESKKLYAGNEGDYDPSYGVKFQRTEESVEVSGMNKLGFFLQEIREELRKNFKKI